MASANCMWMSGALAVHLVLVLAPTLPLTLSTAKPRSLTKTAACSVAIVVLLAQSLPLRLFRGVMMRILGLDVGDRTIGVAVSDALGWTAQEVTVIRRKSLKEDFQELAQLVKEYEVEKFVVGMPRRTDGSYGPEADKVRTFVKKLEGEFHL